MRRIRFNIASLLVIILVLGIGFAALRESNDLWDSGVFTLTLGILLFSILLAVHRTESRRAFWLGFAIFGWVYLGLALFPSIQPRLITTKALAFVDSKLPRSFLELDGNYDLFVANASQPNALVINKGDGDWIADVTAAGSNPTRFTNILAGQSLAGFGPTEYFVRIGHSLFAVVSEFLGGQLSRYLYRMSRQTTS